MTNQVGMSTLALWAGVVGSGVMAGVYFTFSTFVMRSLASIARAEGIAAMQAINTKILSSAFMPLFWATTAMGVGLAVWGGLRGSPAALIGGVVYVLGMFACTAAFNVPLNDALDAVDPHSSEAAAVWSRYLRDWTRWNHVRTVACTLSMVLFLAAISAR